MDSNELLRRAEDLASRCERRGVLCSTGFLSPAERAQLEGWAGHRGCRLLFHGGGADCERTVGFFLPDYLEEEAFDPAEYLCAIRLSAPFGTLSHRDYLGAVLGMGVGREWVGDIQVEDKGAWLFCLPSVQKHLLSLDKVGRFGVRAEAVPLEAVPRPERRVEARSFTVQSLRLDAVLAGLFSLSRTEAARQIAAGGVSLNYSETLKPDCPVREGDVLSLRGAGKGRITGLGGSSRKGRLYVYAERYR